MKNFFIPIFLFLSLANHSQDLIYKVDGTEIKSKVLEITPDFIKYMNFDQINGPIRNVSVLDVFMILYEDGTKDVFKRHENVTRSPELPQQRIDSNKKQTAQRETLEIQNDKKNDKFYKYKKNQYFSTAFGYGTSYGGFGIRQDFRGGKILGFGIHAGAGYFPFNGGGLLANFGAKFYFYKGLYINFQYGYVGIEQTEKNVYSGSTYYHEEKKYTLHGPSFLLGGDWFFGKTFGMNVALGMTIVENSVLIKNVATLDIGFIIKY